MATTSEAKVSLKLLIDTKAKRVLFAEAGKDFVDFLFNLLLLPVGTVVRLLTEQTMVGTLGNLYESIEKLSETYFQSSQTKDSILKPEAPFSAMQVPLLPLEGSLAKRYYTCPGNPTKNSNFNGYCSYQYHEYVTDNAGAICPTCKSSLSREIQFVAAGNEVTAVEEGGFVKEEVTYMVMDDLVVTPAMSTISSITMLSKFNVKDVGALEERVVQMGMHEGLKLLKASLQSKTVRTTGKDFVDFLFNILHLPVGTVVKLLQKQTMVGTLGNLYESIQNLSETYFQSNQTKDYALKPKAPFSTTQVPLLSLQGSGSLAKRYYTCLSNQSINNGYGSLKYHEYVADNPRAICPTCNRNLCKEIQYIAAVDEGAAVGEGGFVKEVVTYMVADDLVVTPMSTISSITMLNKFNVKEVGALEERVVDLGMPEVRKSSTPSVLFHLFILKNRTSNRNVSTALEKL
ncbi:hypothetical protein Vadar_030026 [Vaccinium darrowii]|uniref:Uncharacterized protein n=1 Tax=Vaccinium darrowii TaxID=229202 RepID=A0ACB7XL93_9ERIC|nr:hypothetical protein Vadar_030026 [Vaccinium darrowii]